LKHYDYEEEFHARDRKQFRKERKLSQKLDRSKFKKTDLAVEEKTFNPEWKRGRVVSISGEGALVDLGEERVLCSLLGLIKKETVQARNLIAVGDWVRVNEGAIAFIEERTSFLSRKDLSGRKEQLIAVNIDQVIIVASVVAPPLKPALIDRYLIAAEKGSMHPIIVIAKIDLLEVAAEEEKNRYRQFLSAYEPLGIPILSISSHNQTGLESLRALLQNKTSVFSGQSGVGKSSLLNVCYGWNLKIGDLTTKTEKGSHTTTSATLLSLPDGGYCVDTPGIRSFALWDLTKEDVIHHFSDFKTFSKKCKYEDCEHRKEPECAVLKALEKGKISALRYDSYLTLLNEIEEKVQRISR